MCGIKHTTWDQGRDLHALGRLHITPQIAGSGRVLYVVVAAAGVEAILDSVLMSATGVDTSYLSRGIMVLSEALIDRVILAGRSVDSNPLQQTINLWERRRHH